MNTDLMPVDATVDSVRMRVAELMERLPKVDSSEAAHIAEHASDARRWFKMKQAAMGLRVEACKLECAALRRLGETVEGRKLLPVGARSVATKLASLSESEWKEFLESILDGTSPSILHKNFQKAQRAERGRNLASDDRDSILDEYENSGDSFTVQDVKDRSRVRWLGSIDSSSEDVDAEALLWEDPDIDKGMKEVIREQLRAPVDIKRSSSQGYDTRGIRFVTYFDDETNEWRHISARHATWRHVQSMADLRRDQARRLWRVADGLQAWCNQLLLESGDAELSIRMEKHAERIRTGPNGEETRRLEITYHSDMWDSLERVAGDRQPLNELVQNLAAFAHIDFLQKMESFDSYSDTIIARADKAIKESNADEGGSDEH